MRPRKEKSLNGPITRQWHRLEVKPKSPCADHGKMAGATKLRCVFYTPPFRSPWNQRFRPREDGSWCSCKFQKPVLSGCSECQYLGVFRLCSLNFSGRQSSSPVWEASESALHPKRRIKKGVQAHCSCLDFLPSPLFKALLLPASLHRAST